jgi:hypothetical protein
MSLSLGFSLGLTAQRNSNSDSIVELIAWNPSMVSANGVWEAVDTAKILNSGGTPVAAEDDVVATWNPTYGTHTLTNSTTANRPRRGGASNASPSGVVPIKTRGTGCMRTSNWGATIETYTVFLVARFLTVDATSRWAIGHSSSSTAYALLQSSSSLAGQVRVFDTTAAIEVDTTERLRSFTIRRAGSSGATVRSRKSGEESPSILTTGVAMASGQSLNLGNRNDQQANAGALMDIFAFATVPSSLSRANEQRMEGYLAHRAGLQADDGVLVPGHPYKLYPPMVPVGTTSTLGWADINIAEARQTFRGGYIELQPDSFDGGTATPATDGVTDIWGFPYSLTSPEQNRLRDELFPGDGTRMKYLRFPLGFAYRGLANIDGTSGLAKNIQQRFAGQNTAIANLIANVVADGGGLMPEYWSPAPHWKTTSTYGNGRLWAGAAYSRATTLESIRVSDATQFAAQVEAVTDAMLVDLEYLHANVGPVRGFGLGNEFGGNFEQNYGTWFGSAQEYEALMRSLVPKIRGSAALSTYGGQANTVLIHVDSWAGFGGVAATYMAGSALSTGNTPLQETWAQTLHHIEDISADANWLRVNGPALYSAALGKTTFNNEFEYFDPDEFTDAQRFANTCLQMIHAFNILGAEVVMPIIHVAKQLGQSSSASNTLGYALVKARLPLPYGEDPSTPGDDDPTIDHGEFGYVEPNWNAMRFFFDNVPEGVVARPVSYGTGFPTSTGVASFINASGKLVVLLANRVSTANTLPVGLGGTRKMRGRRYNVTTLNSPIAGAITTSELSVSVPAYSAEVWVEE